jgi:hypothetical protein
VRGGVWQGSGARQPAPSHTDSPYSQGVNPRTSATNRGLLSSWSVHNIGNWSSRMPCSETSARGGISGARARDGARYEGEESARAQGGAPRAFRIAWAVNDWTLCSPRVMPSTRPASRRASRENTRWGAAWWQRAERVHSSAFAATWEVSPPPGMTRARTGVVHINAGPRLLGLRHGHSPGNWGTGCGRGAGNRQAGIHGGITSHSSRTA